ncbi:MAG: MoaD/ThiS family protein [Chloroflexi bacterium]|jgi:MoaD family protein|nr:MoaD/ThiS family protein [Chloroflexota bacterium]
MASVIVRFYSLWRHHLGTDSLALQADNIDEALSQLEGRFGCQLREKLETDGIRLDGKIRDYSLILLNGTNMRNLKSTDLKEGDVLHVFPPAMGG